MSAMLLSLSVVRGLGYYATGEFNRDALVLFAAALPAMLIGVYVGSRVHLRVSEATFKQIVIFSLFLCGIPLIFR